MPIDFRYAPDDPAQAPAFIVPHQPWVDWMLWFVPMSRVFLDWLERFLDRLVAGSPAVTGLLAEPLFGGQPLRQLRVSVYRYLFATPRERAANGVWWTREYLGPFQPLPHVETAR